MNAKTRLSRLEAQAAHDAEPPKVIVIIQSPDGLYRHDGREFKTPAEVDAAYPGNLVIGCAVHDCRRPSRGS